MEKKYESTGKVFRVVDLINREKRIQYNENDTVRNSLEPTENERDRFVRVVLNWGIHLYGPIPPEKYIPYASSIPCFTKWLLRLGYIREVEDDKWDPKSGEWVRVNWKDIQEFQPGVMLNRVLRGKDNVMEITKEAWWRDTWSGGQLLAINICSKSESFPSVYRKDSYYLSDLFRGDVVCMKKEG